MNWSQILSEEEGSASRRWFFSASIWLAISVTLGVVTSIVFFAPDFFHGVSYLNFGRIRPIHVNGILFGWLSMANIGCVLYIVPRLCRTKLYSEPLANATMWLWNVLVSLAVLTLATGHTEGREYAEMIAPLDYLAMGLLVMLAYNIFRTVGQRTEPQLYVSLWYFLGTLIWFPIVYMVGNKSFELFWRFEGLNDAIANWFYGHNVVGLWFTTTGVGLMYYFIPLLTKKPLFSHKLSMLGFWTIALFYAPTGTHHLEQSPVPNFLKVIATVASAGLLLPVFTVLVNFFETMRGKWDRPVVNMPLRFVVTGAFFYLATCVQGPFQATRFINWYLHFSHWVVGHAHLALLGTFSFIVWGAMYHILPKILGREIFSQRLVVLHFWFTLIGFLGFFAALTAAGLVQAAGWDMGVPVQQWNVAMKPFMVFRFLFGLVIVVGQYVFLYNVVQTFRSARVAPGAA